VLGGSLMTMTLGVAFGLAGGVFGGIGSWPVYLIAVVPFAFGLHSLGAVRIPLSAGPAQQRVPGGPVGAAVTGALLGLVITPCATPVLAGLLAYVATTGDPLGGRRPALRLRPRPRRPDPAARDGSGVPGDPSFDRPRPSLG